MNMVKPEENPPPKKIHPWAIAGMVMALVPIFNCLAVLVSIVALVRIQNSPSEHRGKPLAIAALMISLLTTALLVPLIPMVLRQTVTEPQRRQLALQSMDNQRAISAGYTGYLDDHEGWYPRVRGMAGVGGKTGLAVGYADGTDGDLKPLPPLIAALYGAKVPQADRPLNKYISNVKIFHDPADTGGGSYLVPSCWESFGNSYQPQVADDMFRVKRVLGELKEPEDGYEGKSLHEQEMQKSPANKIIQGDWNWPYDGKDTWHGRDGLANHIMLYGDGHVAQFIFPPSTVITNWMLSPAPDPKFRWW